MKKLIQLSLLFWLALSAAAQESPEPTPKQIILRTYNWTDLKTPLPGTEIITQDGVSILKIEKTNTAPLEISLMDITDPTLIKKASLISCEVKCVDVHSKSVGYGHDRDLPVVSFDGPGGVGQIGGLGWFLRNTLTLSSFYPPVVQGGDERTNKMHAYFAGTVNWDRHNFSVSSDGHDPSDLPTRLELSFSMPGTGTIYLRPIKLMGYRTNWWSPEQTGMIGGIAGAVLGCSGGLLGCLAGMGKARRFVLAMTKCFIGLGIILTISGLAAIALHQPYAVWYALLLPGGILTLVFWVNLYPIKKRYDDMEIRRMTSVDTMGN